MKIGIALSGGGYRAATFHLGVLARLAQDNKLEEFYKISTVSGGSILIGLIFASNQFKWPTSQTFLETVVPKCYHALTKGNLQRRVISDLLKWPIRVFTSRATLISQRLRSDLGIDINLSQLPEEPVWVINAATYETGAGFIFERSIMGDYKIGYVHEPEYALSDAIAASAGFPVLVGPMKIKTDDYSWHYSRFKHSPKPKSELTRRLHLWDGGVYDNLGMENLIRYGRDKAGYKFREPIDYLIVSNVSGEMDRTEYKPGINAILRLISIAKFQVESLRSRDVLHRIIGHDAKARYFDSDNYCEMILRNTNLPENEIKQLSKGYLKKADAFRAARIKTEIKNLSIADFTLLFRLGFEVADSTIFAYDDSVDQLLGYDRDHWDRVFQE